jgi:hypothetical protein
MFTARVRAALVVLAAATVLVAVPAESQAIFHWLCPSCWGGARSTYYTPATSYYAPAYSSGCSTCYTPATSYYTPAYSYSPSACSSCSLMPVTTYRPVWSWLSCRPQYTTSYRVVCSNPCATSCCPTTSYCPTSCDPCGGVVTTSGVALSSGCPAGCAPITTTAPAGETPSTYKTERQPVEQKEPLKPEPDTGTRQAPVRTPHLLNPDNQPPARPVRTAVYTRQVYRPAAETPLDTGGWRASRD